MYSARAASHVPAAAAGHAEHLGCRQDTVCAAAGLDEGPASDGGDAMDHAAEEDSSMPAGGPPCDPGPAPGAAVEARRTPAPAAVKAEEPDLAPASAEAAGLPPHAPAPQVCVQAVALHSVPESANEKP